MAYNEKLAARIREALSELPAVEEKKMMGGLVFMYHNKMCVGIMGEDLMCRIDPARQDEALTEPGTRLMQLGKKSLKGSVLVNEQGMKTEATFHYWIKHCLDFNEKDKSSKKKNTDA